MTMSANLHNPDIITITDLYSDRPGEVIHLSLARNGNNFAVFLNDESFKQLVAAARSYAASRSKTIVVDMVAELFGEPTNA